MGVGSAQLKISDDLQYDGEVQDNIPNGKGILTKRRKNKQGGEEILWAINGQFKKGELAKCVAKRNDVEYVGPVKSGDFTGVGKIQIKKQGITYQGEIQKGALVKGQVTKIKQFRCKGAFKQIQVSDKNSTSTNQSQGVKMYCLQNNQGQYEFLDKNQKISGQFKKGNASGEGTYHFFNGDIYKGKFKDGAFEGKGIYTSRNSSVKLIDGNFNSNLPNSLPNSEQNHMLQFSNGDTYVGKMKNGQMHGAEGIYTYKDGTIYKGTFYHHNMTGDCEITYPVNSPLQNYKGEVCEGMFNGLGVLEYKNGIIFKGYFLKNCKNGPCILIYGTRMFKCLYVMDKLIGDMMQVPSSHKY